MARLGLTIEAKGLWPSFMENYWGYDDIELSENVVELVNVAKY
jgi:hypothetical protein